MRNASVGFCLPQLFLAEGKYAEGGPCQEGTVRRARIVGFLAALVLCALMVCSSEVLAQGLFGTRSGVITDSSGGVVPGTTVKVTNVNTNVVVTLTTNSAGVYVATSLNPGVYDVEAEAKGFKTAIVKGITLEVDANPKINLTLPVGQISERIEVTTESAPLLQTQRSDLGQTVNEMQLERLPTSGGSGRSVYSLLPLAAGVSQPPGCDSCGNYGNLRISGSRPRNDDNILDGSTITAPVFGGGAVSPSVDSNQEFWIEQNRTSAEYGEAGGATLTAVATRGTSDLRRSPYDTN